MNNEALKKIREAVRLLEEARIGVEAVSGFALMWNVEIRYCTTANQIGEAFMKENSFDDQ